jgi:hypothetical protein
MSVERLDNGDVIFLARAPGQVADQGPGSGIIAVRGARSGNKKFDPATGRFAGGKQSEQPVPVQQNPVPVTRSGIPQGVTQVEWERRMDMVRDAARELSDMTPEDAQAFLEGRVNDLAKVDVAAFVADVRAQRVDDMADALDSQFRKGSALSRNVRVAAPRGWVKRVLGELQDEEFIRLINRLEARGYGRDELVKKVVGKLRDPQRREALKGRLGVSS